MNNLAVVLNGDQIYVDELIRENARLTVQVEAERQHQQELETALAQLKEENNELLSRAERAEGDLNLTASGQEREKVLVSKLDQAVKDLHFVMADGDACAICKNKCLMGANACTPRWKGLDD